MWFIGHVCLKEENNFVVEGKPCLIKTGVKEGPNKGKSYLICSNSTEPCDHNVSLR